MDLILFLSLSEEETKDILKKQISHHCNSLVIINLVKLNNFSKAKYLNMIVV